MKSVQDMMAATARGKKVRHAGVPARVLAQEAVTAIFEKKGHDVVVMDMRAVSGVADLFVICTGDADLQVKAIVDSVRERIRENCAEKPWHVEGEDSRQWVLVDYVDVVVHAFSPEKRAFYDLERLWGDAPRAEVKDDEAGKDIPMLRPEALEAAAALAATQAAALLAATEAKARDPKPDAAAKPAPKKRASRARKPAADTNPDPDPS